MQPFARPSRARSRHMAKIKATGNATTEVRLRMLLVRAGIRGFSVQPGGLPGRPDFAFRAACVTVFVDGCFWHGCARCGHTPRTNTTYWATKIRRNRRRHHSVAAASRAMGIAAVRIRECDLRRRPGACILTIRRAIGAGDVRRSKWRAGMNGSRENEAGGPRDRAAS
jgi:DNA mismatch endonuclease (patch repair protein)